MMGGNSELSGPELKAGMAPQSIVIIGGGGAGYSAAEMLRREGFAGAITMLSADDSPPCDRPNLSKDYLAGTAPEDWIPLRPPEFYRENRIELVLKAEATEIDKGARRVTLADGRSHAFDKLLIATGAEPVRLDVPGAELPHVRTLRSLSHSRALVERAKAPRRAVAIGASFIGLQGAAALRHRGLQVPVVGPEKRPLGRVLGPPIGDNLRPVHEQPHVHLARRRNAQAV